MRTTTVAIRLTFRKGTDGLDPGPADELAAALRDHLMQTFNDNDSLVDAVRIDGAGLRFTEDEMRALSNALDRADMEVEGADPQDEDEEEAARNNRQDVDTAMGMWASITRELLREPLRACVVTDGELTCPAGHSGDIEHQEQQWERRTVLGIEDGVLKIEGASRTLDDSGTGDVMYCRICGKDYDFPVGVAVDYV
jgi:hypothetical protein